MDMDQIVKIRSALAWRPSPGDMLDGKVVKLIARESDFGIYPIVILDTGDVMYTAVHAFHSLLRDALKELKVGPDDELVIVYQGKIESKNAGPDGKKRSYHNYIVIGNGVDSTVEFSWADSEDEPDF
jgi:hypothetical protein